MKKSLIFHIILLYIAQLSISISVVLFFRNVSNKICSTFLCVGIILYVIATILSILIIALSTKLLKNTHNLTYKFIMILKIIMIPYFVINFIQCFLLIAGFLNPFLFFSLIIVVPLLIGLTYISLLPTTISSTFLTTCFIKNKQLKYENIIVWQVLEYVFVFDIISAIIIFFNTKKCLN